MYSFYRLHSWSADSDPVLLFSANSVLYRNEADDRFWSLCVVFVDTHVISQRLTLVSFHCWCSVTQLHWLSPPTVLCCSDNPEPEPVFTGHFLCCNSWHLMWIVWMRWTLGRFVSLCIIWMVNSCIQWSEQVMWAHELKRLWKRKFISISDVQIFPRLHTHITCKY